MLVKAFRGLAMTIYEQDCYTHQGKPFNLRAFCAFGEQQFGVSFPLLEKVKVNGSDAHPLFVQLKREAPGILGTKAVKWNFTKFLVGRDGKVIARFGPKDHGLTLRLALEAALDKE